MGYRELIDALHKESERKKEAIWEAVRSEAEKIKTETGREAGEMKSDYNRRMVNEVRKQEDMILKEAEKKSRAIRLSAEEKLSDRLYASAVSLLAGLRAGEYKAVFSSLVRELPTVERPVIRVNPRDAGLAREHFPDGEIIPESGITGGLEIARADEGMCVTNTFEKRLERSWEEILSLIVRDIYGEI